MNIRIKSDMGEVYQPGQVMTSQDLIRDYIDANALDNELETFLHSVDEQTAMKFISDMWGLDLEKC